MTLLTDPIPNRNYVVPQVLRVPYAGSTDPLTPVETIAYNSRGNYNSYVAHHKFLRQLEKNVIINRHSFYTPYRLAPNVIINNTWRNILKPIGLTYPQYLPTNTYSTAWTKANNPLSYGVESSLYQVDFETFGCYIHHNLSAKLPVNLYAMTGDQIYNIFKKRPFIQNGSINVFPKLLKNQIQYNQYYRGGYLP